MATLRICFIMGVASALLMAGCETIPTEKPPERNISELFEDLYIPNYSYSFNPSPESSTGYTVGLLDMQIKENFPETFMKTGEGRYVAGLNEFSNEYRKAIEQLLTSKGIAVKGPFASYGDMTYPDRQQCTYLLASLLEITGYADSQEAQVIPEFSQPDEGPVAGRAWTQYLGSDQIVTFKCVLRYEIIEPLTGEKLAIHRLQSDHSTDATKSIARVDYRWVPSDQEGYVNKQKAVTQLTKESTPGFNNWVNVDHRVLEALFKQFIPETDKLISVDEFKHLDKYRKELEEKKVY